MSALRRPAQPATAATETAGSVNLNTPKQDQRSYAGAVDRTNLEQDYKLIIWYRKNNTVSNTNLSPGQKGRLVFKLLGVPRGKCVMMDVSRRDRITLTIHGSVPSNTLNLSNSFEAKPNLWTKPVAPIVKEKTVYIHWTSADTPYQALESTLEHYGVLTSPIIYQVYRAQPGASEEEKLMDGVMSTDREVKMKVRKNIPSIILIEDKKVNIRYEGQARSCSRCLYRLHLCPAKGDARLCQEYWDMREDEAEGPHRRARERGDLKELMRAELSGGASVNNDWSGDGSIGYADYLEMCNLPEELPKEKLHEFLRSKDINITLGQIMRDPDAPSKWRLTELLPAEIECIMLLVNHSKIGKDGRKIECYPAMMSTPPPNTQQPWFAPSRDNTMEDGSSARRDLTDDLGQAEGDKVSPYTKQTVSNVVSNGSNEVANKVSQDKLGIDEVLLDTDSDDDGDDDDEVKEVDADDNTLPRPGSGVAGSHLKVNLSKTSTGYQVKEGGGVKPKPKTDGTLGRRDTPKTGKGRQTLKNLMEAAMAEAERSQQEAATKADKANLTKKEEDLKVAEKAEKAAATAKKKSLTLQRKWDEALKYQEDMKKVATAGKRGPDDQSPGKDEDGWQTVDGKGKEINNKKKKDRKTKSKEELEIERSLFNPNSN